MHGIFLGVFIIGALVLFIVGGPFGAVLGVALVALAMIAQNKYTDETRVRRDKEDK